jgi:hypothetical protein
MTRRHLTFSVPPLLVPFSFQNSSWDHAVSLLYSIVEAQPVNKALDIQEIIQKFLEFNESKFIDVFKAVGKYEIFFSMLIHSTSSKSYYLKTNFNISLLSMPRSPK